MRIEAVTNQYIIFDNGNIITFDHDQNCCECNYADFSVLNSNVINYDYDFDENLILEFVEDAGFKFGNEGHMIFIPCYSEQNGYYSTDIEIFYLKRKGPWYNIKEHKEMPIGFILDDGCYLNGSCKEKLY